VTSSSSPQSPIGKNLTDQTWKQGKAVNYALGTAFVDPNHETLTYTATLDDGSALPSWLHFNAKTHVFTGTPPAGDNFTVQVTATDTDGMSASESFNVTLIDAPTATAGAIPAQTFVQGQSVDIMLPDGTFNDPQGETLTYSARTSRGALPSWLHIDKSSGELTGTVPASVVDMTIVEVATDSSGLSASISFSVTAIRGPVLSHHETNQLVLQGKNLHLSLASEFTSPQHQTLTYTVTQSDGSALPAWLSFSSNGDILSGTGPSSPGQTAILVTVTDPNGLSSTDHFTITNVAAPLLTDQTADQTMLAGGKNSFSLASDTFTDPNGQHLTYTATLASGAALPSWLHFSSATETFTGTPKIGNLSLAAIEALSPQQFAAEAPKALAIEVTAHDASGLTAHETFTLSFTNVPLVGVSS